MRKLLLFLFVLLQFASMKVMAQMDDEFWFAAPAISEFGSFYAFDQPVKFNISSFSSNNVTVTISLPADPLFPPIIRSIAANGFEQVDMTAYLNRIITSPANNVLNTGILIQVSGGKVNVSYEVALGKNSTEIYSLKGKHALGTDFMLPGQDEYSNYTTANPPNLNRMDIVATEDNTLVTITPSVNIAGHYAGIPFSVTLNRGQAYGCIAQSPNVSDHFHGTSITSNKPIAITQTDDNLNDGAGQDLIGDQIIPIKYIGTEYIAVRGSLRNDEEKVYILATENNTVISVGGNPRTTINRGETYRLGFAGAGAIYFTSNKPVYAYQVTGINIELGSAILPPINCTGSDAVKYRRGSAGSNIFKLNIFAPKGGINDFYYNGLFGRIMSTDFSPVPGNGDWMYCSKELDASSQNSVITITNTTHKFHIGFFEGATTSGCAYGFYSGFGSAAYLEVDNNENDRNYLFCEGDSISINIKDSTGITNIKWTGPNGFELEQTTLLKKNLTPKDNGDYVVTGSATYVGCDVVSDFITIEVNPKPTVDLGNDTIACEEFTILAPDGNLSYLWSDESKEPYLYVTQDGTYYLTVTDSNDCRNSDTITVIIKDKPTIDLGEDILLCEGAAMLSVSENFSHILWNTGDTDFAISISQSGVYTVTVTDEFGCMNSDTISVQIKPKLVVDLGDDIFTCNTSVVLRTTEKWSSYLWSDGSTNPTLRVNQSGTYYLTVTDQDDCTGTDSIQVEFIKYPTVEIESITEDFCSNYMAELVAITDAEHLKWNTGDITPTIIATVPGIYSVTATNKNCSSTARYTIENCDLKLYFPNTITASKENPQNGYFHLSNPNDVGTIYVAIYNRFGEAVYVTDNPYFKWDGSHKGEIRQDVVYTYVIKATNKQGKPHVFKGNLLVL